jgi:hypothetical protein
MTVSDLSKTGARELVELDVQFVSAVGQPATGLNFLLAKSEKPNNEEKMEEGTNTNPAAPASTEDNIFKTFVKKMAAVAGVPLMPEGLEEALKAAGYAPSDDAGKGHPNYTKPPYPSIGEGIPNGNGNGPSVGSSAPGTTMKQQADVIEGKTSTGEEPGGDVVLGTPVVKGMEDILARAEKNAKNPEAFAAARDALIASMNDPKEVEMKEQEVKDIVVKALEPMIEEIEALGKDRLSKEDIQATIKAAVDERLGTLVDRLDSVEEVLKTSGVPTKTKKSQIPTVSEPVAKSEGLWGGSVFDVQ